MQKLFFITLFFYIIYGCSSSEETKVKNAYEKLFLAGKQGGCAEAVSLAESALSSEPENIDTNISWLIANDCANGFMSKESLEIFFDSMLAANNDKLDNALALATEACNNLPDYSHAHTYLGILYYKKGENYYDNAIKSINRALQLNSTYGLPYYCLALIFASKNNWELTKENLLTASNNTYFIPNELISKVPNNMISTEESYDINFKNEKIQKWFGGLQRTNNSDNFISSLWPFGPKGFICRHIAPSAYTSSEKMFLYRIGGCLDYKKK